MYTVSITSQGQISIPAKIREELGFNEYRKAIVDVENGRMFVEPVRDLLELSGSLKTTKKALTNKELHEAFSEYMANRKQRPSVRK